MDQCQSCGNEYEECMKITLHGKNYVFDCFECAVAMLAPPCAHCATRVIGHGMQTGDKIYCCSHCARADRQKELRESA